MGQKRTTRYTLFAALALACGLGLYVYSLRGTAPDEALTAALAKIEAAATDELAALTFELDLPLLKVIVPTALAHDGWLLRQANLNAIERARAEARIPGAVSAVLAREHSDVQTLLIETGDLTTGSEELTEALQILEEAQAPVLAHLELAYASRISYVLAIGDLAANLNTVVGYFRVEEDALVFEQGSLQFTYQNNLNAIEAQAEELTNLARHLDTLAQSRAAYPARVAAYLTD